ncbi:MAG: uroporphyrinogen decarboxylase family protein [Opitutales bacterium]|nr:uroporphyrinogen decarboxylase family protein [Opitutales bacterium]
MTGKEILLKALRGETPERIPWVPFAGVHAGSLIGADPELFLRDANLIEKGVLHVCDRYKPDGVPIVFDLQIEAEMLGCELEWASETPPAVKSHPLAGQMPVDIGVLPAFDANSGRLPVVIEATRRLKSGIGKDVALYGLITGPLTLALHLRSAELFMDLICDEDSADQLMAYCADVACRMAKAYLDAGVDVLAVVDPMISQISSEHFLRFVSGPLNRVFDAIAEAGRLSSLFVCGDATRNLEVMCETHCDNVSVDENIDLAVLRSVAQKAGKSFGGNLKLTTTLLLGSPLECQKDAIDCLDKGGASGFILAPGCDLPYAVPPANLEAVARLVHDPYERDVVRTLEAHADGGDLPDIDLPDYDSLDRIRIDVVTLNSAACAPCQYMVLAARDAAEAVGDPIEVVEHKITTKEGLAAMRKLGVDAIPSICIQGRLAYASIIPDSKTLAKAILKASGKC